VPKVIEFFGSFSFQVGIILKMGIICTFSFSLPLYQLFYIQSFYWFFRHLCG